MGYVRMYNENTFSVGEVSNFEGELMDIRMLKPNRYRVGENVTCCIEKKKFHSRVLKTHDQNVGIYVPLAIGEIKDERRKVPRFDTKLPALLNDHISETVYEFRPFIDAMITDISIRGFGFMSARELNENIPYYLYVELDDEQNRSNKIRAKIKIKNSRIGDGGYCYGCEIISIQHDHFQILRKNILNYQLAQRVAAMV